MNNILIMGGLGFIGSALLRRLVQEHKNVTVFDHPAASAERIADVADKIRIIRGNCQNTDEVVNALCGIDVVCALVHTTVPATSMQDPVSDIKENVEASAAWLSRLNETQVKKVIYFSSGGTVYGECAGKIPETAPTNPISSYGITKLAIEKYVQLYCRLYGIQHIIVRPANLYGSNPRMDRPQGLIGFLAVNCLKKQPIQIIGDGKNIRDYVYVDDLVDAVVRLIGYKGKERIFNVGSGKGSSILDIVSCLGQMVALPPLQYVPDRGYDVSSNVLDVSLIQRETQWVPSTDLQRGISNVIASLKQTLAGSPR